MTVERLRREMNTAEFVYWIAYFKRRREREEQEAKARELHDKVQGKMKRR